MVNAQPRWTSRPVSRRACTLRRPTYGAFRSTNRQRGATGQRSHSGFRAWHTWRPCVMRLTCASYICSGSSSARNNSWASSADAFSGNRPMRFDTRSTCRSTGMSGAPNENSSTTDAVLRPTPPIAVSRACLQRGHLAEELEGVVGVLLVEGAQRGLDARRFLDREAARPDGLDHVGHVGGLHSAPVGWRGLVQSDPTPAGAVDLFGRPGCTGHLEASARRVPAARRVPPPARVPAARRARRRRGEPQPQRFERLLRVHVGTVLRQDRQHQFARRVVDALPCRPSVDGGKRVEHERNQAGPRAGQSPAPGFRRVDMPRGSAAPCSPGGRAPRGFSAHRPRPASVPG